MKLGKVSKSRLQEICHLVNKTFAESNHLQEFYWLLQQRVAELPKTYQKVLSSRQFIGELWAKGKRTTVALEYDTLVEAFKDME
jgi:hypothetical protein